MTLLNIVGAVTIFSFNPFMGTTSSTSLGNASWLLAAALWQPPSYVVYAFICNESPDNSLVVFTLFA
jgi:hypothetical protein